MLPLSLPLLLQLSRPLLSQQPTILMRIFNNLRLCLLGHCWLTSVRFLYLCVFVKIHTQRHKYKIIYCYKKALIIGLCPYLHAFRKFILVRIVIFNSNFASWFLQTFENVATLQSIPDSPYVHYNCFSFFI